MAISVKTFINPLNCDEPTNEISVLYDASSAEDICNGLGSTTNVYAYGGVSSLSALAQSGATGNAANEDICQEGMDVVFVVDYTGSMSNAISGVKSGINNIVSQIQSESNGNYRLGLVLFDGGSPSYVNQSDFYADLDSTQKINSGGNIITCVEKMSAIGNQSTFATHLSYIDQPNGPTGMALGASTECGGTATYEVVQNSFAGQWRSNVLRLIILITDDIPDENSTYFNNTLIPATDANNVQVFSNIAQFTGQGSTPVNTTLYSNLSNNTTPAGQAYTGLNFANSTWVNNMISGITTLCAETTTYTCDPAPAGWYTDAPLVAGATIYYWDGSGWTNTYDCQFTVTVDLVDNITNGSVDDIPLNHPNYSDLDTFTFTGAPGDQFTATIGCSPDAGYGNLSVTIDAVSNNSVITSSSVNNLTDEVTFTVTIPTNDSSEAINIGGSAAILNRTLRIDVVNGTQDTQAAGGGGQTPFGYINPEPENTGWTDVGSTYNTFADRKEFTAAPGTQYNITVDFMPDPVDYDLNVTSATVISTDLNGNNGTGYQDGLNAIYGMNLTTGSSNPQWSGTVTIPYSDAWVKFYVYGQVNQPNFRYTLHVSEDINGAQLQTGDNQHLFQGYTGQTFNFESLIENSAGYQNATATSVALNPLYDNSNGFENDSITTGPTINSGNDGAEGVVTMPSGGGDGGIVISGSASAIIYDWVVTIDDSAWTSANWPTSVTFSAAAGTIPTAQTVAPLVDSEYTINVTGVSSSDSSIVPSVDNAGTGAITIEWDGAMPIGGGSSTITPTGTETVRTYSYDLNIVLDSPCAGSFASTSTTIEAAANSVTTGTFTYNQAADHTYSATNHALSDSGITDVSFVTPQASNLFSTNWEVTMPSGGGSGTITVSGASSVQTSHSYTVNYDNSNMAGGNNLTATPTAQVLTGTTGQVIPFTIDLDPSPSYYVIAISGGVNNITTHDGGGSALSATELAITGYNATTNVISGELTMPLGGGTGYVRPKGGVTNPSYTYDITLVENINNVTCSNNTHTFSGTYGTSHSHTFDLVADPGYTYTITYIQHSTGQISSSNVSGDVQVDLSSMPMGGGSATVTVTGTSSQIIWTANMDWDEGGTIRNEGAWDDANNQFTGVAGSTHTLDNTWRTTNNTEFYSESNVALSISGTDYPTSNPFSGMSTTRPSSGTSSRTTGTFTMPIGGGTWSLSIDGSTQTTLPAFTCTDFDDLFTLASGNVGQALQYSWDSAPPPVGLNASFNPSTYQLGTQNYQASITIPSGYSNSGSTITCTFQATTTTTTTTKPAFTCADTAITIASGAVGETVVATIPSRAQYTIGSISPSTYQLGTQNYAVDVNVPNNGDYSNGGSTITCFVQSTGTTTLPSFNCDDAQAYISGNPSNATVGDAVAAGTTNGTYVSVSPSTYQGGTNTYNITITAPSGYSNTGSNITCGVSFGPVTDPCQTCGHDYGGSYSSGVDGNGNPTYGATDSLYIFPDYAPDRFTNNGWITIIMGSTSDVCQTPVSSLTLHKSSSANGTYTNLGTPTLWTWNERQYSQSVLYTGQHVGSYNNPTFIGNLGKGYYYVQGMSNGCLVQTPTIYLPDTAIVDYNNYQYFYGVDCANGDNSNGSNGVISSQDIICRLSGDTGNRFSVVNPGVNPNVDYAMAYAPNSYLYTSGEALRMKGYMGNNSGLGYTIGGNHTYDLNHAVLDGGSIASHIPAQVKLSGYAIKPRGWNIGGDIANWNNSGGTGPDATTLPRGAGAWDANHAWMNQFNARLDGATGVVQAKNYTQHSFYNPTSLGLMHTNLGSSVLCGGIGEEEEDPITTSSTTSTTTRDRIDIRE